MGHAAPLAADDGGVPEAGTAASVEHRLRRLLGAATSRFDQMRSDMREMAHFKEQHDALLGGLEQLLQTHKGRAGSRATKRRGGSQSRSRSASPEDSEARCLAAEGAGARRSIASPTDIKGLLGRIDNTLLHVDRVLSSSDGASESSSRQAAESVNTHTSLTEHSMLTLEEFKRQVLGMKMPEQASHHAFQAISSSRPSSCASEPSVDEQTAFEPHGSWNVSMHALPDLSPCSMPDVAHGHTYQDYESYYNDKRPDEFTKSVQVTANLELRTPQNAKGPLSLSSKPPAALGSLPLETAEAIQKAKGQALRKAREDCNRMYASNADSDLLQSCRSQDYAEVDTCASEPLVIDALSPKTTSAHPVPHSTDSHPSVRGVAVAPVYISRQNPRSQSNVGAPVVINLGQSKKQQQQKPMGQQQQSQMPMSGQSVPLRQVPLQVLSQQNQQKISQHPQAHGLPPKPKHMHQMPSASIFASYTKVHFPGAEVGPSGHRTSGSSYGMSAQLHPRMTGNGPIHVPRLLPKESDRDKENMHAYACGHA